MDQVATVVEKKPRKKVPTTWKGIELKIARLYWGTERRGADYRKKTGSGGNTDILAPGWAIEVKHYADPTVSLLVYAIEQAIRNKDNPNDIPVAVIHRKYTYLDNSIAGMFLSDYEAFFGKLATAGAAEITPKNNQWLDIEALLSTKEVRNSEPPIAIVKKRTKTMAYDMVVMWLADYKTYHINVLQ